MRSTRGFATFALAAVFAAALPGCARSGDGRVVVDGNARFMVLSPTLVRLEYAEDARFEDGGTFNVVNRAFPPVQYAVTRGVETIELRTSAMTLRYRRGSGPFSADNLTVEVDLDGQKVTAAPVWPAIEEPFTEVPARSVGNLGGWLRGLDGATGATPLNDGLLSRDGFFLLDDTRTAVWSPPAPPRSRPARGGAYQDGYLFGYGHDYKAGLGDLRRLTGPAPLLPRWALGNWYSRWHAHSADDYQKLIVPEFRRRGVPLDVLVLDTDWKAPSAWNGWSFSPSLFPDVEGFFAWARAEGLAITLNVHPSIDRSDPHYPATLETAGSLLEMHPETFAWDFGDPAHARSYFDLHRPLEELGVRLWWLDWCCDTSTVSTPGVSPDSWINHLYAARGEERGLRGFAFSRAGSGLVGYGKNAVTFPAGPWADHRSTVHFSGDTHANWEVLAFEVAFSIGEGNIGLPWVSHDIGGFHETRLPEDLYVRWIQLGVFQPILRLHSNHGDRLPWDYAEPAAGIASDFLRLRQRLVPYLYTLGREAHDTGLPLVRGLYLDHPNDTHAYATAQYMLGDELLVAPVASPGDPAPVDVWFPEGRWTSFFSGERFEGPGVKSLAIPLGHAAVYARAGAIVPMQEALDRSPAPDPLILRVYGGADGDFTLYEDAGDGPGYARGESRRTVLHYDAATGTLRLAPAEGSYPGARATRTYEVEFVNAELAGAPSIDGAPAIEISPHAGTGFWYAAEASALWVRVEGHPAGQGLEISR